MTVPVGWLAPSLDCWDTNMLQLLTNKNGQELYPTGLKFEHCVGYPDTDDSVVICVPGRYFAQHTDQINQEISRFVSVLMVVSSDEEGTFDIGKIEHAAVRFWVQTPRREYGDEARVFGVGFPAHFNNLPVEAPEKTTDVFLSAQKSNGLAGDRYRVYERRTQFFETLTAGVWDVELVERDGFAQGDRAEYVAGMLAARVAPAPTGMVSCDSFRFWEALEAGAVPIADAVSAADGPTDYWSRLFGPDLPFPTVTDTDDLPGIVDGVLKDWPATANRVAAFWARYKRQMALDLRIDLDALGALNR